MVCLRKASAKACTKNIELLAIEICRAKPSIMSGLFVTRENICNPRIIQVPESSHKMNSVIWNSNRFLQGTSNMESDQEKLKNIASIFKI